MTSSLCSSISQLSQEKISKANTLMKTHCGQSKKKKETKTLHSLSSFLFPVYTSIQTYCVKSLGVSNPWSESDRAHAAKTYRNLEAPQGTWSLLNTIPNSLNMSVLKRSVKCCQEHGVKINGDGWMYVFLRCGIFVSWNSPKEIKVVGGLE